MMLRVSLAEPKEDVEEKFAVFVLTAWRLKPHSSAALFVKHLHDTLCEDTSQVANRNHGGHESFDLTQRRHKRPMDGIDGTHTFPGITNRTHGHLKFCMKWSGQRYTVPPANLKWRVIRNARILCSYVYVHELHRSARSGSRNAVVFSARHFWLRLPLSAPTTSVRLPAIASATYYAKMHARLRGTSEERLNCSMRESCTSARAIDPCVGCVRRTVLRLRPAIVTRAKHTSSVRNQRFATNPTIKRTSNSTRNRHTDARARARARARRSNEQSTRQSRTQRSHPNVTKKERMSG